jgi:GDP-L-fucose synthase
MNSSVIHHAKEYNVKKLVAFTSTCIFPSNVEYPLVEEKIHQGEPFGSHYAYAYAKRMVDIQNRAYNEQFGTKFFSVIPVNIYGPNDNFHLEDSHVVPALIHKIFLAKENNTDLVLWGTGKPLREFIYVKDIVNLTEILADKYEGTKSVILSTSQETSIKEITHLLCDLIGFKNKVIFDSNKPDGQFRKPSDNSYLKSIVGDYEFTPLEQGLTETVEWFLANYPNIRK